MVSISSKDQNQHVYYEFAVDFNSQNVLEKTETVLKEHPETSQVKCDLKNQQCLIRSSLAPSELMLKLRSATGLSCVLRGISQQKPLEREEYYKSLSTTSNGNNLTSFNSTTTTTAAAVCIFEHFPGMKKFGEWAQYDNRGICRLIQTNPDSCLVDMTLDRLPPLTNYRLDVHEFGDISQGVSSTGDVLYPIGEFQTDERGSANLAKDVKFKIYEIIGRSLAVSKTIQNNRTQDDTNSSDLMQDDSDAICGIIARSAGLFENIKKICSCSGKTVWEENVSSRL